MISYYGPELELYKEALRCVAAITAAKTRGAPDDALTLIQGYHQVGTELGIVGCTRWSILYSASACTIIGLVNLVAEIEDCPVSNVTERMVIAATDQVASGAV